jgi:hypothetical protein
VAWLPPELEVGLEPELKPLELEFELEPDDADPAELDPEELEFDDPEPDFSDEPVPVEELEPVEELDPVEELEPVEEEPDDAEEELVLCVDPGRDRATAPAAATLARVTAVVVERTLARPSSLAAMARRTPSRCV